MGFLRINTVYSARHVTRPPQSRCSCRSRCHSLHRGHRGAEEGGHYERRLLRRLLLIRWQSLRCRSLDEHKSGPELDVHDTEAFGALRNERGCTFVTGSAFYRPESCQARDLAVLAAAVHRKRTSSSSGEPLRVLDCCSASGSRGARYMQQAGASFVWCNDYDPANQPLLIRNLEGGTLRRGSHADGEQHQHTDDADASSTHRSVHLSGLRGAVTEGIRVIKPDPQAGCGEEGEHEEQEEGMQRWRVSQYEAVRLLTQCWLTEDYYDLVDVDSFGSAGRFTSAALGAVKNGGLLYLTCTDGLASSGRTPWTALCEYGSFTAPVPFANEQGLRMVIGAAVMEGARRGQAVWPLFSLFSPHGPVFRVMLQVEQSSQRQALKSVNFLRYDTLKGETRVISFEDLGRLTSDDETKSNDDEEASRNSEMDSGGSGRGRNDAGSAPAAAVCGPLWTGALHCPKMIDDMREEAEARGWSGLGTEGSSLQPGQGSPKYKQWGLEELLDVMAEEADPSLRPGHINVADVSRIGSLSGTPSCVKLIAALRTEGHSAARCHITPRGLYTSASMGEVVGVASRVLGLKPRTATTTTSSSRKKSQANPDGLPAGPLGQLAQKVMSLVFRRS